MRKSKKAIFDSRIMSTRLLVESMKLAESKAKFISSSGINFYGSKIGLNNEGEAVVIDYPDGFLSEVCHKWEAEAKSLIDAGNSVVFKNRCGFKSRRWGVSENVARI